MVEVIVFHVDDADVYGTLWDVFAGHDRFTGFHVPAGDVTAESSAVEVLAACEAASVTPVEN